MNLTNKMLIIIIDAVGSNKIGKITNQRMIRRNTELLIDEISQIQNFIFLLLKLKNYFETDKFLRFDYLKKIFFV